MYKSYEDLKSFVLAHSREEEKSRVEREFSLFEQRGWQPYIPYLANLLSRLDDILCVTRKSVMDSYAIFKAVHPSDTNDHLLSDTKSETVMFNDALRLEVEVVYAFREELLQFGKQVSEIIEDEIKNSGLYFSEDIIQDSSCSHGKELIIISATPIPEDERKIVLNEELDSSESECIILRKYLLLTFGMHQGI